MATGLEVTTFILAVFPLIISGLEHYEEGLQTIKEWIRFRAEYAVFVNKFARQNIFYRQAIEDLLSSFVDSAFDMAAMLDNPADARWNNPDLEASLRYRFMGKNEYDCYIAVVLEIQKLLKMLYHKLKLEPGKVPRPPPGSI